MNKTVYVEDHWEEYENMFSNYGWDITRNINGADIVCLVGGHDVDPYFYGHESHYTTMYDENFDVDTTNLWSMARYNELFVVGICRGGQFINVANGGVMYQDVTNHGTPHKAIKVIDGQEVLVSSTHHQMMLPDWSVGELMMYGEPNDTRGIIYDEEKGGFVTHEIKQDIESVYFHNTRSLAFQPHPEYYGYKDCTRVFFEILESCMSRS